MKHRTDDPLQCYLRCSNANATGCPVEQFTFHPRCLHAACGIDPWSSRDSVHEAGSAGVLAIDEPWGGDETIRQESTFRHRAWRTMPSRVILENMDFGVKWLICDRSNTLYPTDVKGLLRVSRTDVSSSTTDRIEAADTPTVPSCGRALAEPARLRLRCDAVMAQTSMSRGLQAYQHRG
jgi:hypothetical protein